MSKTLFRAHFRSKYYGERKLILRVAFERYMRNHPELRRRV